jgi:hypothetical protein
MQRIRRSSPLISLLLLPYPALAQDISALGFVAGPPILLVPFLAAYLRRRMIRRRASTIPSWPGSIAMSWFEHLLWLGVLFFAMNIYYAERWHLQGALLCAGTLVVSLVLNYLQLRKAGIASLTTVFRAIFALPVSFLLLALIAVASLRLWESLS